MMVLLVGCGKFVYYNMNQSNLEIKGNSSFKYLYS